MYVSVSVYVYVYVYVCMHAHRVEAGTLNPKQCRALVALSTKWHSCRNPQASSWSHSGITIARLLKPWVARKTFSVA